MPIKLPWLNIPVVLFHNFFKESNYKSQAYVWTMPFRLIATSFREIDLPKENKNSLSGKFPFQSHSVRNKNCGQEGWTMDWFNSQYALIMKRELNKR